MWNRFKTVVDVLAMVALVLVAVSVIRSFFVRGADTPTRQPPFYKVGDRTVVLAGAGIPGPALVMHLRSDCKYCTESMPFYQRLAGLNRRVSMVAVGYEDKQALATYLELHGVTPDYIVSVRPGDLKTGGTPTLLLIDSRQTITAVWRGLLTGAGETAVTSAIQR